MRTARAQAKLVPGPQSEFAGSNEPKRIPGLNGGLWVRSSNVTVVAGPKVSAFAELSGSGATFTQTTDANRPTFVSAASKGRSGVLFATDRVINVTGSPVPSSGGSFFLVVDRATAQSNKYLLAGTSNNMGIIDGFVANSVEWFNGAGTDRIVITGTRTAGVHIVVVTQAGGVGTAINVYYDGALTNTKASSANALLGVGALGGATASVVNGHVGHIYEAIMLPFVPTDLVRNRLTRALARQYGATLI